jgi:hypothetical protein
MDDSIKISEFLKTFNEKCRKENADFDKEYDKEIKNFSGLEKDDYIYALQDVQTFKKSFLIPHYKTYNLLSSLNKKIYELSQKELTEEEIQNAIEDLKKIKTELADSKIQIYFCNVFDSDVLKVLAKVAMPYGLLHVGVSVDDVTIQWGRSVLGKSIINPSNNVIYSDYIFAIEMENQPILDLIKETFSNLRDYITNKKEYSKMGTVKAFKIADTQLTIIAQQSVKYNVKKDYNLVLKNCQHFAKKLITKLGLKVDTSGEVGEVLKMAMDRINPFTFNFKGTLFNTRKDFDDFVLSKNFNDFSKDDKRVLFCYRNVFDFYARIKPDDNKYKSSDEAIIQWKKLVEIEKFGQN